MSVLRKSGTTRVSLPGVNAPGASANDFLEAVREVAAAEHYELLGEIGHGKDLSIVYLARDLQYKSLVALRLEPGVGDEYVLEVVQQLDSSIPSVEGNCPKCGTSPRGWGRYCTQCGLDLSGVATGIQPTADLMQAVKEAAGDEFEILGEMSRAQGGGRVYFARQIRTGNIVALRLSREGASDYSLGQTGVLKPLAASIGPKPSAPIPPPQPNPELAQPAGQPAAPARRPQPPPSDVQPTGPQPWEPVIDVLRQPFFLGGLLVAGILVLAIVMILLLR